MRRPSLSSPSFPSPVVPVAPSVVGESYSHTLDPRWQARARSAATYELVIDGRGYGMAVHTGRPRRIRVAGLQVVVRVDWPMRTVHVGDTLVYHVGEPELLAMIAGGRHHVHLRGPSHRLWLNGEPLELCVDAPVVSVPVCGVMHGVRLETATQAVIINGARVASLTKPVQSVTLAGRNHELRLHAPPKQILIDGRLCELDFSERFPVLRVGGVAHGIRFDGMARDIVIDGRPWRVPMERPRRVRLGGGTSRPHVLAFGGPGHEVIIDDQWYVVKFGGPEVVCRLASGQTLCVQLPGSPPEVKVLGEAAPMPPPSAAGQSPRAAAAAPQRRPHLLPAPAQRAGDPRRRTQPGYDSPTHNDHVNHSAGTQQQTAFDVNTCFIVGYRYVAL